MTAAMTIEEVRSRVAAILETQFGVAVPRSRWAQPLSEVEGLNYDSLRVLEVLEAVESAFGIEVDPAADDVMTTFRTLDAISELVARKRADRAALGA